MFERVHFLGRSLLDRAQSVRRRILRGVFEILYHRGAVIYDVFTRFVFAGEWRRWQESVVPFLPDNGLIVELGSGTAELGAALASQFRCWVAIESSQQMITVSKRRNLPVNLSILRASALAIPLRHGIAEAVIATFPTSYIFDERFALETRRIGTATATLVVVLTGDLDPIGIRRRVVRRFMNLSGITPDRNVPVEFSIQGFTGGAEWHTSKHGAALIYVGHPMR